MSDAIRRRDLLSVALGSALLAGLARAAATALAEPPPAALSPEEKKKLKEELQRELERRVYAVDEALFRRVNHARDPAHLEGHETSHVPKIVAPARVRRLEAFPVRIEVGAQEIHEMAVFHYIDWIGLQVDGVQVAAATLTPLFERPIVTFEMTLERSATLRAQEHCNLHGTWESEPCAIEVMGEAAPG